MNREEAKQHLQLCRSGNMDDLEDPLIAEAFAVLESDSELQVWFEDEQAFDARMTAAMETIQAPAGAEAAVLTAMRARRASAVEAVAEPKAEAVVEPVVDTASSATSPASSEPRRPLPTGDDAHAEAAPATTRASWWRAPWLAAAAAVALLFALVVLPQMRSTSAPGAAPAADRVATAGVPDLVRFLADELGGLTPDRFEDRSDRIESLKTHLAAQNAPTPRATPSFLVGQPTNGCLALDYQGETLSLICFKAERIYRLVVAEKAGLAEPFSEQPQFFEIDQRAFKIWIEGDQLMILSTSGGKQDIPDFI